MHAAANYQSLLDSFHTLAPEEPEVLRAVCEKVVDESREALLLQFSHKNLFIAANAEDDTIGVCWEQASSADGSGYARIDSKGPWPALIGRTFGWGWITVNQQGYCDGVLLSFDGIRPTLLLSVIASSLCVSRIIDEDQGAKPASAEKNGS